MVKLVIGGVMLILIAGVGSYLLFNTQSTKVNTTQYNPVQKGSLPKSPADNQLDKDFLDIQNGLNKLDKDQAQANVDSSIQDTPVQDFIQ